MSISIQDAAPADWATLARITEVANDQYSADADPNFWQSYVAATRETLLTDPDIARIIATKNDEIMGSVVYCPPYEKEFAGKWLRNPYPEMRLLSVVPQHRNNGVADMLISACETRAAQEGFKAITLHTTNLMLVAKAMYDRCGYTRFEEIDFEPVPGFIVYGFIKFL